MKIGIFSNYFEEYRDSCGYSILYKMARKMANLGHRVCFVTPSNGCCGFKVMKANQQFRFITTPGIFPGRFRRGAFGLWDLVFKCAVAIQYQFDVIHVINGHRPANIVPCIIAKRFHGTMIVDEVWEWLGKGGYADTAKGVEKLKSLYDVLTEGRFTRCYDKVITISTKLNERFEKFTSATVLPGGADIECLKDYSMYDVRDELGVGRDLFVIGMSNVSPSDHEDNMSFFKALKRLGGEYQKLKLILTCPHRDYVEKIAREYDLGAQIVYPGWVSFADYNKYLSACDIFVLPLPDRLINQARWPNKMSDYISLNRPVITNPTGDVKTFIEKYRIGLFCEANQDGYYKSLKRILDGAIDLADLNRDSPWVARNILSFERRVRDILCVYADKAKS